jgi:hypothetical protein
VSLVGSHARGEAHVPWSDVDLFVLLKKEGVKESCKTINSILSKINPQGIRVWVKIRTEDEFPWSFSPDFLFNFCEDAKTIYGKDIKPALKEEAKKKGKEAYKNFLCSKALNERFFSRYYYAGLTDQNPELRNTHYERNFPEFATYLKLGQIADGCIDLARCALVQKDVLATGNKEVTEKFIDLYPECKLKHIPQLMNSFREKWGHLTDEEKDKIAEDGFDFVEWISARLIDEKD